jgi:hypothetical protein
MHTLLVATILLARVVKTPPATPLGSGPETPRATDLLRAQRMADEARKRLTITPGRERGWAQGGSGWARGTGKPHETLPIRPRDR